MNTLRLDVDVRCVATLRLARPEKHNAMSGDMIAELSTVADQIATDNSIRVVVLAAEGKTFCAGGDLRWMQDMIAATSDQRRDGALALARMLWKFNTLPKPLIGRIHGNAFGGGVGLMSVCDVAIGVEATQFGLTETRLGLIPATIGPYVIARMGEARARRVFMSSRRFDAAEALDLGLLAKVVIPDALDAAVEEEVTPYLSCAPGAVAAAKRLARKLGPVITEDTLTMSAQALVDQWASNEATEGVAAFFEKRAPNWA